MRILVGHIERVLVAGSVVTANGGAWLHGVRCQAVVNEVELCNMSCAGKSCIDSGFVANGPVVAMVIGRFCVKGCGLFGMAHIDHCRQYVVFNFHQLGSVFGLFQSLCDHHGHVVAHITHLAIGKDRVRRLIHGLATGVSNEPAARQAIDLGIDHIGSV